MIKEDKFKTNPFARKYKANLKVRKVMREYKEGELHSGSKHGPEVRSRKQAIAIALNESRRSAHSKALEKKK